MLIFYQFTTAVVFYSNYYLKKPPVDSTLLKPDFTNTGCVSICYQLNKHLNKQTSHTAYANDCYMNIFLSLLEYISKEEIQ